MPLDDNKLLDDAIQRADLEDFIRQSRVEATDQPTAVPERRSQPVLKHIVYKHLDSRPQHPCGAMTKNGTQCLLLTREERCHLQSKKTGQT
jgi:hypothetical protein